MSELIYLNKSTLDCIAKAIIAKDGGNPMKPSQMANRIMGIGTNGYTPESTPSSVQSSLIGSCSVKKSTMEGIAEAIKIKDGRSSMIPTEMASRILQIPIGEIDPGGELKPCLELMDDGMCWINSGVSSDWGLKAEAEIFIPTDNVGRIHPFLLGGGINRGVAYQHDPSWDLAHASQTISPISFHSEDGDTYRYVYREGTNLIDTKSGYIIPRGVWMKIKGEHLYYGTSTMIEYYVSVEKSDETYDAYGSAKGYQSRYSDGKNYGPWTCPTVSNMPIFCAYWTDTQQYMDRMPTGTKLRSLKIWIGNELKRDFVPAKAIDGGGCLYDNVSSSFFTKNGTGNIAVRGNPIYIQS